MLFTPNIIRVIKIKKCGVEKENAYTILVGEPERTRPLEIIFLLGFQLEHRAPFGVSVITYIIRHTVEFLLTSDQPVADTSTYTGQYNM
jgi:hypothetical protein